MSRNIIGFSLFALGVALWVCASLFRFLITSDIPVSFTPEEAMFTQKTFVAAGVLILVGTLTAKANAFHLIAFTLFATVAAFQFYMNVNYHSSATYYTEEYAVLANVSSYIALALALINLILIMKPYLRVLKMRVDLKK
ncbi:hypothetical protein LCD52_13830 [Rossellomorea vietnamensis]|uniref:hypothetical protein n=1 Tax=Rossellomorea vietnamensis TaxID=218284 RepID=UPI001CCA8099|nr:hypothetical protein [Rossellomorea vietnamensis]MCA0149875.1 hypothetical protein [Rossellomorea vietnamensis]